MIRALWLRVVDGVKKIALGLCVIVACGIAFGFGALAFAALATSVIAGTVIIIVLVLVLAFVMGAGLLK